MEHDQARDGDAAWLDCQAVEAWIGGHRVVQDLTLKLLKGQSTAVLGPNGAGKSTLVKLISRSLYPVVKPNSHLRLFGSETVNLWALRQRLGIVSTDLEQRIPASLTGRELLLAAFFGSIGLGRDRTPSPEQRERTDELLRRLDLDGLADENYGLLSEGQRRRLLIARALVHEPEVLVLDEPTNALDLRARHKLLRTLQDLCQQGTTLVMVTHQVEAIIPEIRRVVGLKDCRINLDGSAQEALSGPRLSALFNTPLTVVEAGGYRQVLPG
tara:strand:- start:229 stop:1038 length:810 start_codon:yes stop_codon:yes gene_type:complete